MALLDNSALRWLPLDNAAKIYPAARRKNWSNVFRLSVSFTEPVDPAVLQTALEVTARRFPSMVVRLRRGAFWYYLQQLPAPPPLEREYSYPLTYMNKTQLRRSALRVIPYENRIAVEFFHSVTDGSGALVFLKTLAAEYLGQKYRIQIPPEQGILDRQAQPDPAELEDSFLKYAGPLPASRQERDAWKPTGEPEPKGFAHVTCFRLPVEAVLEQAHRYKMSLTGFLAAVMLDALQDLQVRQEPVLRRRKALKVLIPVDLRRVFPSKTLRNFAMYTTPELLPQLGHYDFSEICKVVQSNMQANITPKQMGRIIATNVGDERMLAVRMIPLFLKNLVMRAVFDTVGERKSCLSMSNLGQIRVPEAMTPYITRFDFILGVQAQSPYNCGVLSWQDTVYVNFIRNIRQPLLEQAFYQALRRQGIAVTAESN